MIWSRVINFTKSRRPGSAPIFSTPFSDINSLLVHAGIHRVIHGSNRSLSQRFPFAIYYQVEGNIILIRAVLDYRRHPTWIRRRLKKT